MLIFKMCWVIGAPEEENDLEYLLRFPDLVSRSNVKLKEGKIWRPSKEEVREGFMVYIKVSIILIKLMSSMSNRVANVNMFSHF